MKLTCDYFREGEITMPVVSYRLQEGIDPNARFNFENHLIDDVAMSLSCKSGRFGLDFYLVDSDEVDVVPGEPLNGGTAAVVLNVFGYPLKYRMKNIEDRMNGLANRVHYLLGLKPDQFVLVKFIPLPKGCIVKSNNNETIYRGPA